MQDYAKARALLIKGTVISYLLALFAAYCVGLRVSSDAVFDKLLPLAICFLAVSYFSTRLNLPTLRAFIECYGCGLLLVFPVVLASYSAMKLNFPLADEQLAAWDSMLGLQWEGIIAFVDQHPLLAITFNISYRSFGFQLTVIPIILAVSGHQKRAYQMLCAQTLLCFLSSFVSIFFPAVGTYSFYEFDASTLTHLNSAYGYLFLDQFNAVRNDPNFVWKLTESYGILTFPSVHAAIAVLCAWALWPVAILRYPFLLLNVFMGLSAVPSANHYAVDVIAGGAIAIASIRAVQMATSPRHRGSLKLKPGLPSPEREEASTLEANRLSSTGQL